MFHLIQSVHTSTILVMLMKSDNTNIGYQIFIKIYKELMVFVSVKHEELSASNKFIQVPLLHNK